MTEGAPADIAQKYTAVRQLTEELAASLSAEDQCLQSMCDVSPVKWHRAHTTWFFETFLLKDYLPEHKPFSRDFFFLYNSFAIFLGILVLTFSNLSIIFDGTKKVTSYQCNESKRQEQERGH